MSFISELPADVEEAIVRRAHAAGVRPSEYLRELLSGDPDARSLGAPTIGTVRGAELGAREGSEIGVRTDADVVAFSGPDRESLRAANGIAPGTSEPAEPRAPGRRPLRGYGRYAHLSVSSDDLLRERREEASREMGVAPRLPDASASLGDEAGAGA